MASDDEIVRLILQIKGQDEARDLSRVVSDLRTKITEAMHAHVNFNDALKDPAIRQDIAQLKEYEAQLGRVNQALHGSGNAMAGSGQAMVQWSRAIQDFQAAGFPGIVNNLELMASSIGAPAFVAGLATLAGVFGPPLIRGIADAVSGMMGFGEATSQAGTAVERLKARIDTLEKNPVKLAVDYLELDNAKKKLKELEEGANAYQAALQGKSIAEVKSGQAVKEMFSEGLMPGEQSGIVRGIKSVDLKERLGLDEQLREQRAQIAKLEESNRIMKAAPVGAEGDIEAMASNLAQIEKLKDSIQKRKLEIETASEDETGTLWKQAEAGDATAQEKLSGLLARSGRKDLAEGIQRRSPMNIEAFSDTDDPVKSGKALSAQMKKARQEEDRQKKEDQQEIDKLAGTFAAGPLADKFLGGQALTNADVKAELEKILPERTAAQLAAAVTRSLMSTLVDKVAKRVAETGQTTDQAKADLADETRAAREAEKARKEADKEGKAGEREADKLAKTGMTQAQADAAYAMLTGEDPLARSPDAVRSEMAKHARDQAKEKDDRTKRAQQEGAKLGGGQLAPSLELALMQGADPIALSRQAGQTMAGRGLVSRDMAVEAGGAAVAEAQKKLSQRIVGLQAQGFDAMSIQSAVITELVNEVQKQSAAMRHMMQTDQQSMNRMRSVRRSRMNGGRS